MDHSKKTRDELITLCKERKLKGYSGKKKSELVALLSAQPTNEIVHVPSKETTLKVQRLNYIGSKYQLLDWLHEKILEKTGFETLAGKTVVDGFAGTGIVSYFLRTKGCKVLANDAEAYSAAITRAFVSEVWSPAAQATLDRLNKDLAENKHSTTTGFMTRNYSPVEGCERKFFTVDNARRIDYCYEKIKSLATEIQPILMASLLLSADAVANVPAVYGCYLKNYKARAKVPLVLKPIHTNTTAAVEGSNCTKYDVATMPTVSADIAYLDPPYNERQYSKNYFPLNMILEPSAQALKGKTGIPVECFLSPFCQKAKVAGAFKQVLERIRAQWVFISYNSESMLAKDEMLKILGEFGTASVVERSYKRFKSFDYNKDKDICEYLFCLKRIAS